MDPLEQVLRLRLACIGELSRFRIVMVLIRNAALSVSGIAREVGLSQSCTTRHLQALAAVGVVERARAGKEVRFALRREDPDLVELLGWIGEAVPQAHDSPPIAPPRTAADPVTPTGAKRRVARTRRIADTAGVRVPSGGVRRSRGDSTTTQVPLAGSAEPNAQGLDEGSPDGRAAPPQTAEPELASRPWQRLGTDLEDFLL